MTTTDTKPAVYWKFLLADPETGAIRSRADGSEWTVGEWRELPPGEAAQACETGFHASPDPLAALSYVAGGYVAQVDVDGEPDRDGGSSETSDKAAWPRMRLARVWRWRAEDSVRLAIYAAEQALDVYERDYPGDARPRQAIAAARAWLADLSDADAAAAAADAAARGADAAAARAAADAARAAARGAAYAAYAAAYAAARGAAYAAARGADDAAARGADAADAAAARAAADAAYAAARAAAYAAADAARAAARAAAYAAARGADDADDADAAYAAADAARAAARSQMVTTIIAWMERYILTELPVYAEIDEAYLATWERGKHGESHEV